MYWLVLITEGDPDTAIPVITNTLESREIKAELATQDHGGTPYEEWSRVLDNGDVRVVRREEDLPACLLHAIPYSVGVDNPEIDCEQLCLHIEDPETGQLYLGVA